MRKGIILFEAIGPFHVNFHHGVPSNTNFFSSSPMCETISQQENRPLSFCYEVCVFVVIFFKDQDLGVVTIGTPQSTP